MSDSFLLNSLYTNRQMQYTANPYIIMLGAKYNFEKVIMAHIFKLFTKLKLLFYIIPNSIFPLF
jgi:hypothetical protein